MVFQAAQNTVEDKVVILAKYVVQEKNPRRGERGFGSDQYRGKATHGNNGYWGKDWYTSYKKFEVSSWSIYMDLFVITVDFLLSQFVNW